MGKCRTARCGEDDRRSCLPGGGCYPSQATESRRLEQRRGAVRRGGRGGRNCRAARLRERRWTASVMWRPSAALVLLLEKSFSGGASFGAKTWVDAAHSCAKFSNPTLKSPFWAGLGTKSNFPVWPSTRDEDSPPLTGGLCMRGIHFATDLLCPALETQADDPKVLQLPRKSKFGGDT